MASKAARRFSIPRSPAFAFRLPDELKVRHGLGKWLLRRWLGKHVPTAQPLREEARLHRAGRRLDRAARRAARAAGRRAAGGRARSACRICVETLFREADGKREGFAAWTLLFYALWHRHHILGLPPAYDVFTALTLHH